MAELNTKSDALKWRRYYPKWNDLNEGPEDERWWVEVRKEPSRKQALAIARQVVSFDKDGEAVVSVPDNGVYLLERSVRGPFNLLVDGEIPESLSDFLIEADSQELISELEAARDAETELGPEKEKNSGAPSGGDSMQPDRAIAESASEAGEDAQDSTGEESDPPSESESGESER